MSIAEVEAMDGDEVEEWRIHFSRYPFTQDLLDYLGAQIALVIAQSMGGNKKAKIADFLLIKRKKKVSAKAAATSLHAVTS